MNHFPQISTVTPRVPDMKLMEQNGDEEKFHNLSVIKKYTIKLNPLIISHENYILLIFLNVPLLFPTPF